MGVYKTRDIYEDFVEKKGKIVDYATFFQMICDYNSGIADLILQGYRVNLGFHLGSIQGVRIKRRKGAMRVDFGRTNKSRDENGKVQKVYYFQSKYYGRIKWHIKEAIIKNRSYYKFVPAYAYNRRNGVLKKSLANIFMDNVYDPVKKLRYPLEDNTYTKEKKRRAKNASTRTTTSG